MTAPAQIGDANFGGNTKLQLPYENREPWALPATQFSSTYLAKLDRRGLEINSLDLRHTWLLGYDDYAPLNITPGIGVHFWSGSQTLDLPPRLYDLYVDLEWQVWQGERSAVLIGATPGLYGDLERVDSETWQWSGWMIGTLQIGRRWNLVGGIAYLRQLESNWLPLGGAVWMPSDNTRAEIIFPCPRLAQRLYTTEDRTGWLYVSGQFGGGAWSVLDTPEQNVLVGYSDIRLMGGLEVFHRQGHQWRCEVGYAFSRQLRIDSIVLEKPSDSIVAQLSFAF